MALKLRKMRMPGKNSHGALWTPDLEQVFAWLDNV